MPLSTQLTAVMLSLRRWPRSKLLEWLTPKPDCELGRSDADNRILRETQFSGQCVQFAMRTNEYETAS